MITIRKGGWLLSTGRDMKLKTTLLGSIALAMIAGAAAANPLQNPNLSFGYESFEDEDTGNTTESVWGKVTSVFDLGEFDTTLGLTYAEIGDDDSRVTFDAKMQKDLGDVTAGAFLDFTKSSDDNDSDFGHIGLAADYDMGAVDVAAFAGFGKYTQTVGGAEDSKVYGVSANFDLPGAFDASATFKTEEMDDADYTEKGLAVGYDLSEIAAPVYISLAVTKTNIESTIDREGTRAGVTITIPLGGKLTKGGQQAHAHSARANTSFLSARALP